MKTKLIGLISGVALIGGLAIAPATLASNSADVTKALAGSTVLELPAKAANLVAKASAADKQNVAVAVVKAAVGLNPSAAIVIVSAVARENPATAPVVAVTAATLQQKRIDQIAKATAAAAPPEAANIVAALTREFPQDCFVVAVAAAEGAPSAGREILAVVADYVPALQSSIQVSTATFVAKDGVVPVRAILSRSCDQAVTSHAIVTVELRPTLAQTSVPTVPPTAFEPMLLSQSYTQASTSGAVSSIKRTVYQTGPMPADIKSDDGNGDGDGDGHGHGHNYSHPHHHHDGDGKGDGD